MTYAIRLRNTVHLPEGCRVVLVFLNQQHQTQTDFTFGYAPHVDVFHLSVGFQSLQKQAEAQFARREFHQDTHVFVEGLYGCRDDNKRKDECQKRVENDEARPHTNDACGDEDPQRLD